MKLAGELTAASGAVARGDIDTALGHLHRGFAVAVDASFPGRPVPMAWPSGDRMIGAVAGLLRKRGSSGGSPPLDVDGGSDSGPDVFVATRFYGIGGHTALLVDYAAASSADGARILLTGCGGSEPALSGSAATRLGALADSTEIAPDVSFGERAEWLVRRLRELRPGRVFLFHHPDDATAVAGVMAADVPACFLVHHVDSTVCSGLFCEGVRVIDLLPYATSFSREVLGLSAIGIPLGVPDIEFDPVSTRVDDGVITATNGSSKKFLFDGPLALPGMIARILDVTRGRHFHIGPLSDKRREMVVSALSERGVPADCFVPLGNVPNLAVALREHGVQISIVSFPFGGARATIESLMAGIPQVWHSPERLHDHWRLHLKYPSAEIWRRPSDLEELLGRVTPDWIADQSHASRVWYEERFHERLLVAGLAGLGAPPERSANPAAGRPSGERERWDVVVEGLVADWQHHQLNGELAALRDQIDRQRERIDFLQKKRRETLERLERVEAARRGFFRRLRGMFGGRGK